MKLVKELTTANEIALALAHLKLRERELLVLFEKTTVGYDKSEKFEKK